MRIRRVQNNNSTNFTATIKVNQALKDLKAGLTPVQSDKLQKCIYDIENVNDGKVFAYQLVSLGDSKIAKIREITDDNASMRPIMVVDYRVKNPIGVFEQLASRYRSRV